MEFFEPLKRKIDKDELEDIDLFSPLGRGGYALVRNGEVIDSLCTIMN